MLVPELGEGNGEVYNGDRVSIWKDEKALERDRGDGCTPLNLANTTKTDTYKSLRWYIFCYVYFTTMKRFLKTQTLKVYVVSVQRFPLPQYPFSTQTSG